MEVESAFSPVTAKFPCIDRATLACPIIWASPRGAILAGRHQLYPVARWDNT